MHILNLHAILGAGFAVAVTFCLKVIFQAAGWDLPRPLFLGTFAAVLLAADIKIRHRHAPKALEEEQPGLVKTLFHPVAGGSACWVIPMWLVGLTVLTLTGLDALGVR